MTRAKSRPGARSSPLTQRRRRLWSECGIRVYDLGGQLVFTWFARRMVPVRMVCLPYRVGGGWSEYDRLEHEAYMALSKNGSGHRRVAGAVALNDPDAQREFPTLWDHLTQTRWEDGTARIPSTLMIFVADGMVKVMLRDRAEGLCLWVSAPNLASVWDAIELSLSDPSVEWRMDRQMEGQKASRVKKSR